MIVKAKSRWKRIHFKCSPFDESNVSPYLKTNKVSFNHTFAISFNLNMVNNPYAHTDLLLKWNNEVRYQN